MAKESLRRPAAVSERGSHRLSRAGLDTGHQAHRLRPSASSTGCTASISVIIGATLPPRLRSAWPA